MSDDCSVCHLAFVEVPACVTEVATTLGCGHKFHVFCICTWFLKGVCVTCPMCRQPLESLTVSSSVPTATDTSPIAHETPLHESFVLDESSGDDVDSFNSDDIEDLLNEDAVELLNEAYRRLLMQAANG